jgi:amino acid transporter
MAAVEPLLRGESGGSGSTITINAGGGGGGGSKIDGGGRQPQRTLTLLPLAALIFFEVSGGPYGVEDAVGAAGPFWALLGFVTFPLIWSVPEALVCAELTGLFPENAGYVAWVTEAFGPFAGFVEGWCSWWSGAIDNAIYPGLFLQYVRQLSGGDASSGGGGGPAGWLDDRGHFLLALLALNVLLTYLNWRGLEFVGRAATVLVVLAVSPFLAMTVLAVPRLDLSRLAGRRAQPDWGLMINTLMWNLNYWDSASTLSGEVIRPRTTIPRALALTVVIVVCVYTVPIVVGCALVPGGGADSGPGSSGGAGSQSFTSDLGAPAPDTVTHGGSGGGGGGEWEQWQDGYFTTVAEEIGGKWLGVWLLAAAALSAAGQYLAEMSSNSFQLEGASTSHTHSQCSQKHLRLSPLQSASQQSLGLLLYLVVRYRDRE